MVNREIVMDYILSCLQDLVENGVEIKPDSDLVNDLGLESIKVMDLWKTDSIFPFLLIFCWMSKPLRN